MKYKTIKTFEDACVLKGYNPETLPNVSMLPEKFQKWITNTYKLGVITEAINTDENGKVWEPNYNDHSEYKYFPWFEVDADEENPAGVGFSYSFYDYWRTHTRVGSRLCFDSRDKVNHVQEHFEELYKEYLLILK